MCLNQHSFKTKMSPHHSSVNSVQSSFATKIFTNLSAGIKTAGLAYLSVLALQGSNTLYAASHLSHFVDLESLPFVSGPSLTFTGSDGTTLNIFDGMITGVSPSMIQSNIEGVCAYTYFSSSSPFGSRCGYSKDVNNDI